PDGASLDYSTYLSGSTGFSGSTYSWSIAVNGSGEAFVTGITNTQDFPLINPIITEPATSGPTVFVSQLNATGSSLLFSSLYSGSKGTQAGGVALDSAGAVYIAGTTFDTDLPTTPSAFESSVPMPPPYVQPSHGFVAKLDLA